MSDSPVRVNVFHRPDRGRAIDRRPPPINQATRVRLRGGAAAIRLSTDAFRSEPDLALDPAKETRSTAARYAALTAAGRDQEAALLDEPQRAHLRTLALGWLRDDLTAWQKRLEIGNPADRIVIARTMRLWQTHPDLASVRDADTLARLPEGERTNWQQFWQDVAGLLKRADESK